MKLKRFLAAALAGVMAITSSVVTSVTAGAEPGSGTHTFESPVVVNGWAEVVVTSEEISTALGNSEYILENEFNSVTVNYTAASAGDVSFGYRSTAANGYWASGDTQTAVVGDNSFTFTKPYELENVGDDFKVQISGVVTVNSITFNCNYVSESISAANFTYSTLTNTTMAIGDTVTIAYDSTKTPVNAKYAIKYKVDNNGSIEYYAPVYNNAVNGTEGQAATGLEVTSSTSGAVTTYTFTAVAASVGTFEINVETSAAGDWSDTAYLWFGSATSYNVPAYEITTTAPTNGTLSVDKTEAAAGETVTVTATPATDYELDAITVNGNAITGTTFEMPAEDVTVAATFKAVESDEPTDEPTDDPTDEPTEDVLETGTYTDGKWSELSAEELAAAGTLNTITTVGDEYLTTANVLSIQYSTTEKKLRIYKVYKEEDLADKTSASIVVKKGNVGLKLTTECVYTQLASGQTAPEGCYYIAWVISGVDDPTEFSYSDITLA